MARLRGTEPRSLRRRPRPKHVRGRALARAFHAAPAGHSAAIARHPRPSSRSFRHYRGTEPPSFAHPSEEHFAGLLDDAGIPWLYEPHTFALEIDDAGRVRAAITPDFYLPDADVYVELTAMRQPLVTRKNRKLRRLESLHDVIVTIRYRRDLEQLGWADDEAAA